MIEITDAQMRTELERVRAYCLVLLKAGPAYTPPDRRSAEDARIVWEHGRRNMALRAEGKMPLVGPIGRGDPIVGVCVFSVPELEARALMDADPAIMAGIFVYDILDWYAFPGDSLP